MPVQTQMSSFAKTMGARIAQAHEEHKDKPADSGDRRLPPGIKNGIAKLAAMYTKQYENDNNGPGTKGQVFFRASAIVLSPKEVKGEVAEGCITQVIIPLCDMPAKGQRKAKSFNENWYEFQNLFKILGVPAAPYDKTTDPTGQLTEGYYFAAMKALTDPVRMKENPVYVSFSSRGWTPPPTVAQPKPTEMVFEEWHGLAEWNGHPDPSAGVTGAATGTQPDAMTQPPTGALPVSNQPTVLNPNPTTRTSEPFNELASGLPETDPADIVEALVAVAMNDPDGATEDGANASAQLEEMAWKAGWTKEQTAKPPAPFTDNWAGVGDMALNPPTAAPTTAPTTTTPTAATNVAPAPGTKHKFAKRTKDGAKLKDAKGTEFPAQEVEVVTVDAAAKTCTVKTVKDGKPVVDIRTKAPVAVKFEWLE